MVMRRYIHQLTVIQGLVVAQLIFDFFWHLQKKATLLGLPWVWI
jgi:hypothetical protein